MKKSSIDSKSTPHIRFRIEYSSPFFSGPSELTIRPEKLTTDSNKVVVNFHPKEPGFYQCKLLFLSNSDVRVVEIEGTATAKSTIQVINRNKLE